MCLEGRKLWDACQASEQGVDRQKYASINDRSGKPIKVGDYVIDTSYPQAGEGIVTKVKVSERDGKEFVLYKNEILGGKESVAWAKDCAVSKRHASLKPVQSGMNQGFRTALGFDKEQQLKDTVKETKERIDKGESKGKIWKELNGMGLNTPTIESILDSAEKQ
jgi:hypothetical protein